MRLLERCIRLVKLTWFHYIVLIFHSLNTFKIIFVLKVKGGKKSFSDVQYRSQRMYVTLCGKNFSTIVQTESASVVAPF